MKYLLVVLASLLGLTACSSQTERSAQQQQQATESEKKSMSKHHSLVRQPVGKLKVSKHDKLDLISLQVTSDEYQRKQRIITT